MSLVNHPAYEKLKNTLGSPVEKQTRWKGREEDRKDELHNHARSGRTCILCSEERTEYADHDGNDYEWDVLDEITDGKIAPYKEAWRVSHNFAEIAYRVV